MAVELTILGWRSEGLRCPDYSLNLQDKDGKVRPVSLIQMPNGVGKTTTLTLLRTALSGAADKWTNEDVSQLRKKASTDEEGIFIVDLLLNEQKLTIELTLNFEEGSARYRTTYGQGIRDGFHPPQPIRK